MAKAAAAGAEVDELISNFCCIAEEKRKIIEGMES
jgi:hypothetical protein